METDFIYIKKWVVGKYIFLQILAIFVFEGILKFVSNFTHLTAKIETKTNEERGCEMFQKFSKVEIPMLEILKTCKKLSVFQLALEDIIPRPHVPFLPRSRANFEHFFKKSWINVHRMTKFENFSILMLNFYILMLLMRAMREKRQA